MDFYGSKEKLYEAFQAFIKKTTKCVVLNFDCKNIQKNLKGLRSKKITNLALGHRGAVMLQNFPPVSCRNI